jgi:hypothetical protein
MSGTQTHHPPRQHPPCLHPPNCVYARPAAPARHTHPTSGAASSASDKIEDMRQGLRDNIGRDNTEQGPRSG